jgi:hypothetical protein
VEVVIPSGQSFAIAGSGCPAHCGLVTLPLLLLLLPIVPPLDVPDPEPGEPDDELTNPELEPTVPPPLPLPVPPSPLTTEMLPPQPVGSA